MKKITVTITTLGLLAILSCWLVFHISCKKEDDCSGCYLTNDQLALMVYTKGQKVIFKNDSTNTLDTLNVEDISYCPSNCSSPCYFGTGCVEANFTFSHLSQFYILISPLSNDCLLSTHFAEGYGFDLNTPTQTVTVNSTTYNDAYIVQVDSTTINHNGDQLKVPWKIYYSKSKGFVRFFMVNGQTWSKL